MGDTHPSGSALWIVTSFMNHSKNPNTLSEHFGKFKLIFANDFLKTGTELTICYGTETEQSREKWNLNEESSDLMLRRELRFLKPRGVRHKSFSVRVIKMLGCHRGGHRGGHKGGHRGRERAREREREKRER